MWTSFLMKNNPTPPQDIFQYCQQTNPPSVTWPGLLTAYVQFNTAVSEFGARVLKLCQRIKNKEGNEKWGRIVSFWQNRLASSGQDEIFMYSYLCVHLYVCTCVRRQNPSRDPNIAELPVRIGMRFTNKITHFSFHSCCYLPHCGLETRWFWKTRSLMLNSTMTE